MGTFEEALEKLKVGVEGGQEYMAGSETLALTYITEIVYSALQDVLKSLIEKRHKVVEAKNERENSVIHYTSIDALVSILQGASKKEQERMEKEREDKKPEPESTISYKKPSWRLYDSAHLNDPDEGNYFTRNLKLPKKYKWVGKIDVRRAYVASFILRWSHKIVQLVKVYSPD